MQRLNGVHAQRANRRRRRRGHLFGERFSSWIVETEEHARAACRYVLLNPVRAGLCERAEDWRWSGSRYGKSP
jgi:putative transposase